MAQERCPGQLFDARLARRWRCIKEWCALIGFGLTIVVLPLAVAALPDPLWVAGVYDGNDYDDLMVMGTPASCPHIAWFGEGPLTVPTRLAMIGRVTVRDADVVNPVSGTYTVKVGVFSSDWSMLYKWDNQAATFIVP